jgi:hypothetical protein
VLKIYASFKLVPWEWEIDVDNNGRERQKQQMEDVLGMMGKISSVVARLSRGVHPTNGDFYMMTYDYKNCS